MRFGNRKLTFRLGDKTPTQVILRQIDREFFQVRQRTVSECAFVGGPQHDTRRSIGLERFLPTWSAKAPSVAGIKPRKAKFWHGRRQIVAARFRVFKKFSRHDDANRVTADIFLSGVATAITIKAGHRLKGTNCQRLPQHIECRNWLAAVIGAVVSEHGRGGSNK